MPLLEIVVKGGNRSPVYDSTIEDEESGGQATVLPFRSQYGDMGWARERVRSQQ